MSILKFEMVNHLTHVRIAAGDRLVPGQLSKVLLLAYGLVDFLFDQIAIFL